MTDITELRELEHKLKELRDLPQKEAELAKDKISQEAKNFLVKYEGDLEEVKGDFLALKMKIEDDKASVLASLKNLHADIRKITQTHTQAKGLANIIAKSRYELGIGLWSGSNSKIMGVDLLHEVSRIFEQFGIDGDLLELQKLAKFSSQLENVLSAKPKPQPMFGIVDHNPDSFHWER